MSQDEQTDPADGRTVARAGSTAKAARLAHPRVSAPLKAARVPDAASGRGAVPADPIRAGPHRRRRIRRPRRRGSARWSPGEVREDRHGDVDFQQAGQATDTDTRCAWDVLFFHLPRATIEKVCEAADLRVAQDPVEFLDPSVATEPRMLAFAPQALLGRWIERCKRSLESGDVPIVEVAPSSASRPRHSSPPPFGG